MGIYFKLYTFMCLILCVLFLNYNYYNYNFFMVFCFVFSKKITVKFVKHFENTTFYQFLTHKDPLLLPEKMFTDTQKKNT